MLLRLVYQPPTDTGRSPLREVMASFPDAQLLEQGDLAHKTGWQRALLQLAHEPQRHQRMLNLAQTWRLDFAWWDEALVLDADPKHPQVQPRTDGRTQVQSDAPTHATSNGSVGIAAANTNTPPLSKPRSAERRRRQFCDFRALASDMDSTLINIECIDELGDAVGMKEQIAALTHAAMSGEKLEFSDSLRARVALLKDVPEWRLAEVYEQRLRLNPGAQALFTLANEAGIRTLLVSGGFTYFTVRLQRRLGIHETLANVLDIQEGKLTGHVLGGIVDGAAKLKRLLHLCAEIGCEPAQAIAVGDGANDLPMLRAAGLGVAYCAREVVRQNCRAVIESGWLDHIPELLA